MGDRNEPTDHHHAQPPDDALELAVFAVDGLAPVCFLPAVAEAPSAIEPVLPSSAPPAVVTAPTSRLRRVLNWLWRGAELRALRRDKSLEPARCRELRERAKLTFELARRVEHPSEPLPAPATAVAVALLRQTIYWAVRAVAIDRAASAEEPWASVDAALAAKLLGGNAELAQLSASVEHDSFAEVWELNKEQQALRVTELSRAARGLLDELEWRQGRRDALLMQRAVRLGAALLLIGAVVFGVRWFGDRSEQRRDIAGGKAWRASSTGVAGCRSPQQQCAESPDFFFHTSEEHNAWVEVDLGAPTQLSAVRVINRKDCCQDRASPLVVEVSSDQATFKEVARRSSSFSSSWLASFPPTRARYVRLRIPGKGMLHLSQVRVLR